MPTLIDAYDSYKDFNKHAYFTVCFDTLPSVLALRLPMKETKEHMDQVLRLIDTDRFDLEVIYKNWNTEDAKNADFSKDFIYQQMFKSKQEKLLVSVDLDGDRLAVDFLYEAANRHVEEWITATNHAIRTTFGEERGPVFKVLSKDGNSFFTEDVKTKDFDLNIGELYNDDFQEVHETIMESLTADRAGLILLHGDPGTGKTSYIKGLITKHPGQAFIFIQNEFVNELLRPDFVSFLLNHKNAVLIIEDAEKVIITREQSNANSVVSTILQLTDGLFSDYLNIKIICTFNTSIEKIDKALLRKGRMIAYYDFKPLKGEKAAVLMGNLGADAKAKEMTLAEIFSHEERGYGDANKKKKIGF
ncbi:AAA family ATPase [Microscilla marina]|nr:AAA family ATPase [Microscilla marina]